MLRLELPERANPELLRRAAELRQHMTPEERIVWQELRGNRLGLHFRRQHPLPPYIVDFYCHQGRLVVELDGSPHRQQQGYDYLRDSYLARFGIRVLRVANQSVRDNLPAVIHLIRNALQHSPYPPHPLSGTERGNRGRKSRRPIAASDRGADVETPMEQAGSFSH